MALELDAHQTTDKDQMELMINATSQLEFLQQCQDYLATASTFKSVLKRLVVILDQYFGVTAASYFVQSSHRLTVEAAQQITKFPPVSSVDDQVLKKAKQKMAMISADESSALGQIAILDIDQKLVYLASFNDPSGDVGFFVWQQPDLNQGTSKLCSFMEMGADSKALLEFIIRSSAQAANWIRKLDRTEALLYQDEVTGLYNYRYLDVAIDSEIKRLQRFHSPFSLLFIDLDNFKQINDEHGHLAGSLVLKQVGDVIKLAVRDVDNVIRYGGDEFVVVLIGANSRQAMQAAERVRTRVEGARFQTDQSKAVNLTASIGVASCPDHGRDKTTILKLADETMYKSKKSGKNRVMMVQMDSGAKTQSMLNAQSVGPAVSPLQRKSS